MKFLRFRRYPYPLWAAEIAELFRQAAPSQDASIVDAPCGDGVIDYWLIRYGIQRNYELYDIATNQIEKARRLISWAARRDVRLSADCRNLLDDPPCSPGNDVWLLVNSLYLLEDIDSLLVRMRPRARYIIGIFPMITHPGYQAYLAQHPGRNVNEMDEQQTCAFFARHGYELRGRRESTYISTRSLRPIWLRMAVTLGLNPLDRFFRRRPPCYWVGLFCRNF